MNPIDPLSVFGPRVDNYIKYRPGYPPGILQPLVQDCGLAPSWLVADIGSGTGLFARLFLDLGCLVAGVEPNEEMRRAGEQLLAAYPGFTSLPGSAEASGLADASVDLVSAGMAFHWFDIPRAALEFRRILKPGGWVALAWNRLPPDAGPFMRAYTSLVLEFSPGWTETQPRDRSGLDLPGFFGGPYRRAVFPFQQPLDWEGLRGRTLSIAHAPLPEDPACARLASRLQALFDRFQEGGQVLLHCEAELYYGRLSSTG
jgi:SAM-dependent methyltransferase